MPYGRSFPLGALGGVVSGLFLLAMLTGSGGGLILELMAPLPLFIVGLALGLLPLLIAVMFGILVVSGVGGLAHGIAYAGSITLPVLGLMALALKPPRPPSADRLALGLSGVGIGLFGAAMAASADSVGGLQAVLRSNLVEAFNWITAVRPDLLQASAEVTADRFVPWAGGAALTVWLLVLAANAALANGALTGLGWKSQPMPGLAGIEVPRWVGAVWAAMLAAGLSAPGEFGFAARNLSIILALPLLFGGLGLVHALVARIKFRLPVLVGFYVFVFALGWPVVLVVALGIVEQWVRMRQRMAAAPRRGEE